MTSDKQSATVRRRGRSPRRFTIKGPGPMGLTISHPLGWGFQAMRIWMEIVLGSFRKLTELAMKAFPMRVVPQH